MNGPWLQTAVLCERVAGDREGRLAAVNVLEGVAVDPGARFEVQLIVVIVRGGHAGPIRLEVAAIDPQGAIAGRLEVEGDPSAVATAHSRIVLPIELVATPGVWWFEIRFAGAIATRVPLRVDRRAPGPA